MIEVYVSVFVVFLVLRVVTTAEDMIDVWTSIGVCLVWPISIPVIITRWTIQDYRYRREKKG